MKIQYASDLHLELRENMNYIKSNPLPVVGDILVLAGDPVENGIAVDRRKLLVEIPRLDNAVAFGRHEPFYRGQELF